MDNYVMLGTSTEELSRMVRGFKDQTKKLKEKVELLGTAQDCKDLREELSVLREQCMTMSKQLGQLFKSPPVERSERWKHVKLAQDFETILKEFERTKAQALSKEKQWIDIVRESISSEEYRNSRSLSCLNSPDQLVRQESIKLQELGCFSQMALESMQKDAQLLEEEVQATNVLIRDMAELVQEQGKGLDSVEESAGTAAKQSEKVNKELVLASEYQSRNCCVWLWVFGLLFIIGVCVGVYFALSAGPHNGLK
jgi:hypothetical protein